MLRVGFEALCRQYSVGTRAAWCTQGLCRKPWFCTLHVFALHRHHQSSPYVQDGLGVWSNIEELLIQTGHDLYFGRPEECALACANDVCHAFQAWQGPGPLCPGSRLPPGPCRCLSVAASVPNASVARGSGAKTVHISAHDGPKNGPTQS